jgi:hypothetical protein
VAPDLTPYIQAAFHGRNTGPATIQRMLTSLETQLQTGPLAQLQAGTIDMATFATNVNNLVVSYQSNVSLQLSPSFPTITSILTLQGTKVESLVAAVEAQSTAGLITSPEFNTQAASAISSLTSGPLRPLNTPNSGFVQATKVFQGQLNALTPTLAPGANPALTPQQLQTVVDAEAKGYGDAMAASLVGHPTTDQIVNNALTNLTNSVANIAAGTTTSPTVLYLQALNAFDQAILDVTGLFGPLGLHGGHRNG